ncbi:recombinase family protein [Brevundimonas sp. Marseille-Q4549]
MKRCGIYLRVSTDQQTTENQFRILQEVAERSGWTIVQVFEDAGISGAKGRDQRPGYDALLKAVHRREINMVAAFAVDRLGRSLPDLVAFLSDSGAGLRSLSAPTSRRYLDALRQNALRPTVSLFRIERELVRARVNAGLDRARSKGVRLGRPSIAPIDLDPVRKRILQGQSIRVIAKATGFSTATVQRVKRSMHTVEEAVPATVAA